MSGKKTHRQIQKEGTRKLILAAAYQLFATRGYAKTTMRALAEQAGVGLGTISKHFPDKSSLLVAAFQEDLSQIIQESFKSLPKADLKKQLLHLAKDIFAFYADRPDVSRALLKEILFLRGAYGESIDALVYSFLGQIEELIQAAIDNGELKPYVDPKMGAYSFWSFYFMTLVVGLKQPEFIVENQLYTLGLLIYQHFYD